MRTLPSIDRCFNAYDFNAFEVVTGFNSYDNYPPTWSHRQDEKMWGHAMDIIFSVIREDTFWKILLFIHFLLALVLLAALTLQVVTVLMPARQVAGGFVDRGPIPAASYATLIAVVYLLQALMGAWIYIKYRTYVRIPMEELRYWWTVGAFDFKEHTIAMGVGLLPA